MFDFNKAKLLDELYCRNNPIEITIVTSLFVLTTISSDIGFQNNFSTITSIDFLDYFLQINLFLNSTIFRNKCIKFTAADASSTL